MKPKMPTVLPDARTVLPGREVTYHAVQPKSAAKRDVGRPAHDMRMLVLNVLVGARARWSRLAISDKQKIVRHLRAIADLIEKSIGGEAP